LRLYGTGAGKGKGGFLGAVERWFGTEGHDPPTVPPPLKPGRGLHSFSFQLNLSRLGYTSACPPV